MNSERTWVLIADGGHASVFETQANHPDLTPVEEMTFSANLPANRDILTDVPGARSSLRALRDMLKSTRPTHTVSSNAPLPRNSVPYSRPSWRKSGSTTLFS